MPRRIMGFLCICATRVYLWRTANWTRAIHKHWTQTDIPIAADQVFKSRQVNLRLNAAPFMLRTYCLMLATGVME